MMCFIGLDVGAAPVSSGQMKRASREPIRPAENERS
jgi:hypothetical protein